MPRTPNRILGLAIARGEQQSEVADAVGVTPETLSLVACGRLKSWPKIRRRLAEHFDVDERELFPDVVDA